MKSLLAILFFASLSPLALVAAPETPTLEDNPFVLGERLASIPATDPLADYYAGVAAANFRQVDKAEAAFTRFLARPDAAAEHRRKAMDTLGGAYLLDGRYAKAAELFQAEYDSFKTSVDADTLKSIEQNLGVAKALSGAPRQETLSLEASELAITRDRMGLANIAFTVNGAHETAVWDTGANFSSANESFAKAHHFRFQPGRVEVSTSTGQSTFGQMAIAEELTIGKCRFKNVAFLVLPDAALSFPDANYAIQAVIGYPVIEALGCIRFPSRKKVRIGLPHVTPARPELAIRGLTPIIRSSYRGNTLPFFLDSGATQSSLRSLFAETYPDLLKGLKKEKHGRGGAGGMVEAMEYTLPKLTLELGGSSATLRDAQINEMKDADGAGCYGTIGSDVLFAGQGYEIDLQTMHFRLLR